MKKIILEACRHTSVFSPLADEENREVHPALVIENEIANKLLIDSLFLWQRDYNSHTMYSFWSLYQKLSFEREGLRLAQLLSLVIPRELEFSYHSKLYEQEIKFYQHE